MLSWLFKAKGSQVQAEKKVCAKDFHDPDKIIRIFESISGMNMQGKEAILKEKLVNFCDHHDICSFAQLEEKLLVSEPVKDAFISYLTVNETFFFREMAQIDFMIDKIKQSGVGEINILSLPCASGEEPYTIAIKLHEALPDIKKKIVGMDISPEAIEKAKTAAYSTRKLKNIPFETQKRCFDVKDESYVLSSSVREDVVFYQGNIFDPKRIPGRFDYIFCRNLFIYFEHETKVKALSALEAYLKPGGILFLGHADVVKDGESNFEREHEKGLLYYILKNRHY